MSEKGSRKPSLRSREERDTLVKKWSRIPGQAIQEKKRFLTYNRIDLADAYQECRLALVRAAELWDEKTEVHFYSYALAACRQTLIWRGYRDRLVPYHSHALRNFLPWVKQANRILFFGSGDFAISDRRCLRGDDGVPDKDAQQDPIPLLELEEVVQRYLKALPPNYAFVIRSIYFEGQENKQVAKALGLTKQRISQIEIRALQKLANLIPFDLVQEVL